MRCNCCNYSSGGFDCTTYGEAYKGAKIQWSEKGNEYLCTVCLSQINNSVFELKSLEDEETDEEGSIQPTEEPVGRP